MYPQPPKKKGEEPEFPEGSTEFHNKQIEELIKEGKIDPKSLEVPPPPGQESE